MLTDVKWNEPKKKADFVKFAKLNTVQRVMVRMTAKKLDDGSRTVAQCWKDAMRRHSI